MTLRSNKHLALALLLAMPFSCMAATITVNSTADDTANDGSCTLREAIYAANGNAGSGGMPGECVAGEFHPIVDEIVFDGAAVGVISIDSPLAISADVFVDGPGAGLLAIDGTSQSTASSMLRVTSGNVGTTIGGLTFQNSDISAGSFSPLQISSPTTFQRCVFQDNQSKQGGAITSSSDLTIDASIFRRNTATQFGGGAIILTNANLDLIVRDSLFEDNQALGTYPGGAITVGGEGHHTLISGSSFAGNQSQVDAGAINFGGAEILLENSTFSGNLAGRHGGAMKLSAPVVTLASLTIADNIADADENGSGNGGGVFFQFSSAAATVRNSIIADNLDSGSGFADCAGSYYSDGYNLIGQADGGCTGFVDGISGDQVGSAGMPLDPQLGALLDNGGPTPTMLPSMTSLAINGGNPSGCADTSNVTLLLDQRGLPRPEPSGSLCDIGAVELQPIEDTIFRNDFE